MHLTLYQKAMARYGQGKGKYAPKWLASAQAELEECRAAVPAWVMPTYRVAEALSPSTDAFDVVIVDEASQSGVDALFLWWLGKKVVIVGDDEQISPDAVGIELEPVFALRDQLLGDQPIGRVIAPTTSLFDLGDIAFTGNRTYLREHFRCMPEIIAFSNKISYPTAPLEPLRQFGADRLPPLESRHVTGATRSVGVRGNINRDEAHEVAETIIRCIGRPEYGGRSMGVISLTGEHQAKYIERLLLEQIGPDEMLARRLKCGDAYAFQGDERDVMFLSMVAAPTDRGNRLAALAADTYRRRFNVSASRARDQMWLFHSVTQSDLNPDCLRWKLLEHFLHFESADDPPELAAVNEHDRHPSFDSLFEQRVYLRIKGRGYSVRPQFEAYNYRIDLVVTGGENRLAVECDGDQWHGPEQFEHDLARQQDLERVGWRFVRIRESEFYLDPEAALRPLWLRLQEAGIRPVGEGPETRVLEEPADTSDLEAMLDALLDPFEDAGDAAGAGRADASTASEDEGAAAAAALGGGPGSAPRGRERLADQRQAGPTVLGQPPAPPGHRGPGGLQMAPYRAWQPRRLGDPRMARQPDLVNELLEVVGSEGPIIARRAYRLVLQAAGFHRLVHNVVSPLNKAALRAEREGRLIAVESGVGATLADRVLRLPDQLAVVVRERGPRDLEEIPASEIQAAARGLWGPGYSPDDRALLRAILTAYGRTSLTGAAASYLERSLRARVPEGPAPIPLGGVAPLRPTPPSPPVVSDRIAVTGEPARPLGHAVPEFRRTLASTLTQAKSLTAVARARLASEWLDDEAEDERQRVVAAAARNGAPREWSTVARVASSTLVDWPAAARGAAVDAAFALAAGSDDEDAAALLRPWRAALNAGRQDSPSTPVGHDAQRCPHGNVVGKCPYITCTGHFLGGMAMNEN